MRKISRAININHETIRNIAKFNLGLKPFKQHTGNMRVQMYVKIYYIGS